MMRLRELEAELQHVRPFDKALQKPELEQYPTSAHIAARMIHAAAAAFDDVEGRVVVDLGCGTGMLGLGCGMMGACAVIGVDADMDALEVAVANRDELELGETVDFMLCDLASMPLGCAGRAGAPAAVDTVVMNPPFGTRNKGVDVLFLERALALRPRAIYSLHKSATRNFLLQKAARDWGVQAQVLAQLRFDIPQMYKFHKKKSKDVEVDFIRFELPAPAENPTATPPPASAGAAAEEAEGPAEPAPHAAFPPGEPEANQAPACGDSASGDAVVESPRPPAPARLPSNGGACS